MRNFLWFSGAFFGAFVLCQFTTPVYASDHRERGHNSERGDKERSGRKRSGKRGRGLNDEMRGAFIPKRADTDSMDARGFFETGLRPVYPDDLNCQKADSFFGDTTRGNGSVRSPWFYEGRHGGLDIPAKGIPIIAIADGEVIEKGAGSGDGIGGIKIVLRHSPEDTGLKFWTFTEYKHLEDESPLALNAKVKKGTKVGLAGNTGTTGGRAYGTDGHYHLHLSAWYNATGEVIETRRRMVPKDGYWLDPLAMMHGGPLESTTVRDLPSGQKQVRFAYTTSDGSTHPKGAKIVWPFMCR